LLSSANPDDKVVFNETENHFFNFMIQLYYAMINNDGIKLLGFSRKDAMTQRKNKQITLRLCVFARNKSYQF